MHRAITIADVYPLICEKLEAGGRAILPASGQSMWPLLRHNRDSVVIVSAASKSPQKNDLALYICISGQFKLHRIVGFDKNGDLVFCGENQFIREHHVNPQQIVGYVEGFTRNCRAYHCSSKIYLIYCLALPVLRILWFVSFRCFNSKYARKLIFFLKGDI